MLVANNPVTAFSAPTSSHPVGFSLEEFCWLFSRVRSLSYSVSSIDGSENSPVGSSVDAADALAALIAATSSQGEISAKATVERFLEDKESNLSVESPVWRGLNMEIDLGRSVSYFGLYYPWIRIFAGSVNSFSPRVNCGAVRFLSKSIPLYADSSSTVAAGKITVSSTYDDIRLSSLRNRTAIFTSTTSFLKYNSAYLGSVKCDVSGGASSLVVSIPPNAKSGHVRFISSGPPYDSFLCPDRINL